MNRLLLLAALLLPASVPARAASTDTARSSASWLYDYAARAREQLSALDQQLRLSKGDAERFSGEARAAADERVAALQKQVQSSRKDLDDLRRTGRLKAAKARKRLDAAIEDLRREYEGLRKDLEKNENK